MRKVILLFLVAFCVSLSISQEISVISIRENLKGVCGTPIITDEYIENALEKTKRINPKIYDKIIELSKKTVDLSIYGVGDSTIFYAIDLSNNTFYTLTAELRATNQLVNIWVEKEELSNNHVTDTEVNSILDALTNSTPNTSYNPNKGIIEIEQMIFGNTPNKDGDGIVDFLVLNIKDDFEPYNNDYYMAGYFSLNDQKDTNGSNKRDMLYIDSYPGIYNPYTEQRDIYTVITTTAHELQHLIHYNYDINEDKFLNEGLSQFAQIVTGYNFDNPSEFFRNTNQTLYTFSSDNTLVDYVKTQMFVLYLFEQFDYDFIKSLVHNSKNGVESIKETLTSFGSSRDFNQILADWGVANYLNEYDFDPKFGYNYSPATKYHASPHSEINNFPFRISNFSINGMASKYISFVAEESLVVNFSGSGIIVNGIISDSESPQVFDVTVGQSVKIDEIVENYDYIVFSITNYFSYGNNISIESNALQQIFYVDIKYDDGTPDPENSPILLTMKSGDGFAVRFTPPGEGSTLKNASLFMFSDESGNDIDFHIWEVKNDGYPGSDMINPFSVTLPKNSNGEWVDVDLSDYSAQLSDLQEDIFVGFVQDDDDLSLIGLDDSNPNDHYTYFLFGPERTSQGWIPFNTLKAQSNSGEISLSPYNAMMRLKFSYIDPSQPILFAGVLQNPVYTENLDIYVIGEKELNLNSLSGTFTIDDEVEELEFKSSGNTGRVFVDDEVTVFNSGEAHIEISGSNKHGLIKSSVDLDFNVGLFDNSSKHSITTPDNVASLRFKENSLSKKVFVTAFVDKNKKSETYTFKGPSENLFLKDNPVIITIKLEEILTPNGKYSYCIERKEGENWVRLKTRFKTDRYISAESSKLGTFRLSKVESNLIPDDYVLFQNYPNPFNNCTSIKYKIIDNTNVKLEIYNLLGQKVKTLINKKQKCGTYELKWDGKNEYGKIVASGIYIYRMITDYVDIKKKMVFLK